MCMQLHWSINQSMWVWSPHGEVAEISTMIEKVLLWLFTAAWISCCTGTRAPYACWFTRSCLLIVYACTSPIILENFPSKVNSIIICLNTLEILGKRSYYAIALHIPPWTEVSIDIILNLQREHHLCWYSVKRGVKGLSKVIPIIILNVTAWNFWAFKYWVLLLTRAWSVSIAGSLSL